MYPYLEHVTPMIHLVYLQYTFANDPLATDKGFAPESSPAKQTYAYKVDVIIMPSSVV